MTIEQQALLANIEDNLSDPVAKLIYADWLDERKNHDLAYAYRWAARWKKHPRKNSRDCWQWFKVEAYTKKSTAYRLPIILAKVPKIGFMWTVHAKSLGQAFMYLAALLKAAKEILAI